jgi:predicted DNA-binding transcriptional regulator AlpA
MIDDTEDGLAPTSKVSKMLGKSRKSINRLQNDPELCFPQPIIIQGKKYWKKSDIFNWIDDMKIQSEGVKLTFHGDKRRAAE